MRNEKCVITSVAAVCPIVSVSCKSGKSLRHFLTLACTLGRGFFVCVAVGRGEMRQGGLVHLCGQLLLTPGSSFRSFFLCGTRSGAWAEEHLCWLTEGPSTDPQRCPQRKQKIILEMRLCLSECSIFLCSLLHCETTMFGRPCVWETEIKPKYSDHYASLPMSTASSSRQVYFWSIHHTVHCHSTNQRRLDTFVTQCCSQLLVLVGIVILFQCLRADKWAEVCGRHEPPLSGPKPFPLESPQALQNLWVTEARILTKFFPEQVAGIPSNCASKSHGAA